MLPDAGGAAPAGATEAAEAEAAGADAALPRADANDACSCFGRIKLGDRFPFRRRASASVVKLGEWAPPRRRSPWSVIGDLRANDDGVCRAVGVADFMFGGAPFGGVGIRADGDPAALPAPASLALEPPPL